MTKLSDTQRVILSAAAQHEMGLARAPKTLPAAARNAVFRSLIKNNLLTEINAPREHVGLGWRQDEDGTWIAARITDEGLRAIGIDPNEDDAVAGEPDCSGIEGSVPDTAPTVAPAAEPAAQDATVAEAAQANYSSLRAGKIEFRRLCEQVQCGMLIPMLVRPIADRFHQQGALLGLWGAGVPEGLSHVPPAHEMIDPLKDTTALIAQVRAGFVPQPEAVGAFGYDFRQVVEMIREANALLDEAGLSLDSDPRRVAKSGAAQDAAQLAAIEIAATGAAAPPRSDSSQQG